MNNKNRVYLTSSVFYDIAEHEKVAQKYKDAIEKLKTLLHNIADVIISEDRFPSADSITKTIKENKINFVGCHLSHKITLDAQTPESLMGVATSTAGFNHISLVPEILYTHTPSILDKTVADFTISIILANLRNVIGLHNFLWSEKWSADQKWDLDENLNSTMDNLTLGIVGLGEIGREIIRRLAPWGINIKYYDIERNEEFEKKFKNLSYCSAMEEIFEQSDIVSLHLPLNEKTTKIINGNLLKKMKKNALLVNTARGGVINFDDLIQLLKSKEITINLSFDVYEPEPISVEILSSFKEILQERPQLRFVFIPHNASADADTRAQMSIIILEDLITMIKSQCLEDLKTLRFIPSQRNLGKLNSMSKSEIKSYRIAKKWE
jgi:glyoxylate reductase